MHPTCSERIGKKPKNSRMKWLCHKAWQTDEKMPEKLSLAAGFLVVMTNVWRVWTSASIAGWIDRFPNLLANQLFVCILTGEQLELGCSLADEHINTSYCFTTKFSGLFY